MKKLFALMAVVVVLGAASTIDSFGKAPYCYDALRACAGNCRDVYGSYNPVTGWCETGCSIGYLFC
jgi:hypothetical protein